MRQAEMLERLRAQGYKSEFAARFKQARQTIDDYLSKKK